jgi:hypothetical protein
VVEVRVVVSLQFVWPVWLGCRGSGQVRAVPVMCSKMRLVSVVATSLEALRFLTTKSRRSSADLAAR